MQSGWPSLTRLSEGISAALLPPNCPASALVTCFQMISLPELDRKKTNTHTTASNPYLAKCSSNGTLKMNLNPNMKTL